MTYVLDAASKRAADAQACAALGADTLMQRAGERIATVIRERFPNDGRIVAFAGPGNNGGDAYAALAALPGNYERSVLADPCVAPSQARAAAQSRAGAAGVRFGDLPRSAPDVERALEGCDLAIDALFGTGARLPIDARFHAVIDALDGRKRTVLAIDLPSGVNGDTGVPDTHAVRASLTIALAAVSPGLLQAAGHEHAGELYVADIGIAPEILAQFTSPYATLDDRAFLALLPQRSVDTEKRSAGAPFLIAGSEQFPGASVLASRAAARAGAGYVTLATSVAAAPIIRTHLVETVVVTISDDDAPDVVVRDLLEGAKRCGAIAIGPGLGLSDRTGEIVRGIIQHATQPIVADASALFHLSKHLEIARNRPIVITPHEGEFARISGLGTIKPGDRVARLREFVHRTGITTLLKGHETLIYDGTTMHVNLTGTNALATAGSGDVLTGIIGALLSQGLSPLDAARCGAYWHGLAGQACARERSVGTIAGDLPEALAQALPPDGMSTGVVRLG